ncbi:reverse transcriptase domain, reverse transcriptase zinc-binding domain protein [Tanacetum coccineum]
MSILVNGSPSDEFGLERGVRQGYPLSTFLFILAAEGLNALVNEAVEKGIFRGVTMGTNNITVSHLQYADDTILFGEWSKENAKSLMCILKCFEEVSGLRVNFKKSKIYGIRVNEGEMMDMARWMGCNIGEFPFTYLVLPIGENMRHVNAWIHVVEKFKKRLSDWKAKTLSFGGRLTLVKSVLGSLPLFGGREGVRDEVMGGGVWGDIVKIGDEIDGLGRKGGRRFCFFIRGVWVDNNWVWGWDWIKSIRGRVSNEFEDLIGDYLRLIEEKILISDNGGQETLWNKLVPKKVNIFIWRALRGRLSVRLELDKRGVDLDSVLCPSCDNIVETCAHCLITCDLAMCVIILMFGKWLFGLWGTSFGEKEIHAFLVRRRFLSSGTVSLGHFRLCFITSDRLQLFSSATSLQLSDAVQVGQFLPFEWWFAASGTVASFLLELWSAESDSVVSSSTSCL